MATSSNLSWASALGRWPASGLVCVAALHEAACMHCVMFRCFACNRHASCRFPSEVELVPPCLGCHSLPGWQGRLNGVGSRSLLISTTADKPCEGILSSMLAVREQKRLQLGGCGLAWREGFFLELRHRCVVLFLWPCCVGALRCQRQCQWTVRYIRVCRS